MTYDENNWNINIFLEDLDLVTHPCQHLPDICIRIIKCFRDRLLDDRPTDTLILESFNLMNDTLLRMNGDLETILESPGLKFSFGNMYTSGIKIILAFPLKL